jgi:Zn-dependent peptidase ImmA (M78 family)
LIKFRCRRVDKKHNNTPIISDAELDELAEVLLDDYKPELLREPRKINYLHFLESYLGANVEFQDIYYGLNENQILGATIFNDETLKVFDHDNMCTTKKQFNNRTIVIDNYVTQEGLEGLELFTGLHEGGHLWLHPDVYSIDENQVSVFDMLSDKPALPPVICCRRFNIESFGAHHGNRSPEDWREHQADYFASAIAMPKRTFKSLVEEYLKKYGFTDGFIITGSDIESDEYAFHTLPKLISEVYGVSKTAARVKLSKYGYIVDTNTFSRKHCQTTLY